MAPGLDELEWRDYVDFTGGLWERGNDRQCLPNGLLECTDCFPDPDGGLRAFARFHTIKTPFSSSTTWVTPVALADAYVIGLWFISSDFQGSDAAGLFMMTIQFEREEGGDNRYTVQIWRLASGSSIGIGPVTERELEGESPATWRAAVSRTIKGMGTAVQAVSYHDGGLIGTWINFPAQTTVAGQTHGGLYQIQGSSGSFSIPSTNFSGNFPITGLAVHQNRLLFNAQVLDGRNAGIWYTEPGSTVVSTANYIAPSGINGAITFMAPYPPSELVFLQEANFFGSLQGPITAPTIRQLSFQHLRARNYPVRTDIGMAMVVHNEGLYIWDGSAFQHASRAISGDPMGGTPYNNTTFRESNIPTAYSADLDNAPGFSQSYYIDMSGQLGVYENWLFCNNGYMMDLRTGAWFKQTSAPGARYWASDALNRRMYVSTRTQFDAALDTVDAADPSPLYWSRMGQSSWDAMDTYSFTLPLIESPGQRTNVRELEYQLSTYNATSTITVEVTAPDTGTITLGPYPLADSKAETVRILVPGHPSEWYKVRTILSSNRSEDEAPTLAGMRIGTQASTRTPVNRA